MCDLICDVISCCTRVDKIMVENKKRKYGNRISFFNINLHVKDGVGIEFTAITS